VATLQFPKKGATALMLASKRGHVEVVKLLLENEVDVAVEMVLPVLLLPLFLPHAPKCVGGGRRGSNFGGFQLVNDALLLMWHRIYMWHRIHTVQLFTKWNVLPPMECALIASWLSHSHTQPALLRPSVSQTPAGESGGNALVFASIEGHQQVVQLILDYDLAVADKGRKSISRTLSTASTKLRRSFSKKKKQ
jgi:ankyrin repeat protein